MVLPLCDLDLRDSSMIPALQPDGPADVDIADRCDGDDTVACGDQSGQDQGFSLELSRMFLVTSKNNLCLYSSSSLGCADISGSRTHS